MKWWGWLIWGALVAGVYGALMWPFITFKTR